MPEVIQIDNEIMPWYYNLTHSVGRAAVNQRLDVMLVQYLINKAFETPGYSSAKPRYTMVVDEVFGPVSAAHLSAYQRQDNAFNGEAAVLMDGRVDRASSVNGTTGSISQRVYTITGLNKTLHDKFPGIFFNPSGANDMPGELKFVMSEIAASQAVGV